jgi:hypothetical protein
MPRLHLTPGKTQYPLYSRLGGPHGWSGQVRKISPPPGFDTQTIQPIGSRCTDYKVATWTSIKGNYCHFSVTHLCPPCTKLSTFSTIFSRKLKILKGYCLRCRVILYLGKYSNGSGLKIVRLG